MSADLKNPFPSPETISKEINDEYIKVLCDLIDKQKLNFDTMLDMVENVVSKKDLQRALICGYYCTNVLIKDKYMEKYDKIQTISTTVKLITDNFEDSLKYFKYS